MNKRKEKGQDCYAPARVSQPSKPGHIGQTLNAREFSYATCCTLHPLLACGWSTAALLLPSPQWSEQGILLFYSICRKKGEPTSGLEPLT